MLFFRRLKKFTARRLDDAYVKIEKETSKGLDLFCDDCNDDCLLSLLFRLKICKEFDPDDVITNEARKAEKEVLERTGIDISNNKEFDELGNKDKWRVILALTRHFIRQRHRFYYAKDIVYRVIKGCTVSIVLTIINPVAWYKFWSDFRSEYYA